MTVTELEAEIRKSLARITEEDLTHVRAGDDLGDAIGLDSLGRLELLADMEERLDLTIYDVDSDNATTIAGMLDILQAALAERAEVA